VTERAPLRDRAATGAADIGLRANLRHAVTQLESRRPLAYTEFADAEGARAAAQRVRLDTLRKLPELLGTMADNVLAAGGHVHWADTGDSAVAYVASVLKRHHATRIVKSKSMLSEEIHLNAQLEQAGFAVTETDLGEWIIQLAGQTPSHILAPAVHLNRTEIAGILGAESAEPLATDSSTLTDFARSKLREAFLIADVGITGVNFAVAESGAVVIVTNEGNAGLTTALPNVHIALMGMERIVESWRELDVMMSLLPRAATGQSISTYVDWVAGARHESEADGPEEFHLVIVDNGRSDILGSEYDQVLTCIRCGACSNVCPVYSTIGGHAYGSVYTGPIGAVLTPLLSPDAGLNDLAAASSLCGACWETCPVGIPLHDLLLELRYRESTAAGSAEKAAWNLWSRTWSKPSRYQRSLSAAARLGSLSSLPLPGPTKRWETGRTPIPVAETSLRKLWKRPES
jgi:L-lactate dehydrogenase complex protein LldF